MADNIGVKENNERFVEYPYNIRETWWNDLQLRKMRACGRRIRQGEVVVDVGCNSGYLHEFLPPACEIHGVDLSPALVAIAQTRYTSAIVAPAEALPFPDRYADVVTILGVIEYVFDPVQVMKELARVARRAILIEANHEDGVWGTKRVEGGHPYMVRGYNEQSLRELCSTVGVVTWIEVVAGFGAGQHRIAEVTM
jgi:SAM-dependent methyltransferase